MSRYSVELDLLHTWVQTRAAELGRKWAAPIYDLIQGSPYSFEAEVLIDDAINRQARVERLAYMRGEPIPDETSALAGLLAELDRGAVSQPETPVIGVPRQESPDGPQANETRFPNRSGDGDVE
jgi:hypothetical protein